MINYAKKRWVDHKNSSKKRNIEFKLTFEEWYNWWLSNGIDKNYKYASSSIPHGQRMCMCRFKDAGAYELGNIYCTTMSQNIKEKPASSKITKQKPVHTPLGDFRSIRKAAKAHNSSVHYIIRSCITNPKEFYYIEDKK